MLFAGGALFPKVEPYMEAPLKIIRNDISNYYNPATTTFSELNMLMITNDPDVHHLLDVLLLGYFHPYKLIINQQKTEKICAYKGSQVF